MEPLENIDSLIDQLESDHEHGAHYFAERALHIMTVAAESHIGEDSKEMLRAMWRAGKRLIEIRPAMSAGIINAVTELWALVLNEFLVNPAICPLKSWVREKKERLLNGLNKTMETSTDHAAGLVPSGATVFLLSYSSSVIKTIEKAASKNIRTIVAESRPLCEGVRAAEECTRLGVETTLITDSQAGIFTKDCSLVLIGADAILASGDVINKAGSSLIAAAASEYKVPLHVVAHTWKIHPGDMIQLEEKSPSEVLEGEHPFRIRNIYFDITSAVNITSIATEHGLILPSQIPTMAESVRGSLREFMSNPLSA
jgi:translation initiation factor 2B subunit (eIF-2B alpha/beta/delta family)